MSRSRSPLVAPIALVTLALALTACGDDNNASTATTAASSATPTTTAATDSAAQGDVLAVAAEDPDLSTFLAALDASGLMDTLHGPGPYTVFIPTNDAFRDALGEMGVTQDQLFADPAHLADILTFHIVNMNEDEAMVMQMDGQSFTTENGAPLSVSVDGATVMIAGATIVKPDLMASNGVIHVIDKLLTPPT
jgi:uncharacterized surface protein with fasciclin (FAS1) repeats